jgi:hypothetical protein
MESTYLPCSGELTTRHSKEVGITPNIAQRNEVGIGSGAQAPWTGRI